MGSNPPSAVSPSLLLFEVVLRGSKGRTGEGEPLGEEADKDIDEDLHMKNQA